MARPSNVTARALEVVARTAATSLAAAVLVAGCGSSDRLEYERDVAKAGRTVDKALERYGDTADGAVDADDVAMIASELREAADQLEDLDPPTDAAAAQTRLVTGLRGVATAYDELAADLREAQEDRERAELFVAFDADPKVNEAFEDLAGAHEAYLREGYRVFGEAPAKQSPDPEGEPADS